MKLKRGTNEASLLLFRFSSLYSRNKFINIKNNSKKVSNKILNRKKYERSAQWKSKEIILYQSKKEKKRINVCVCVCVYIYIYMKKNDMRRRKKEKKNFQTAFIYLCPINILQYLLVSHFINSFFLFTKECVLRQISTFICVRVMSLLRLNRSDSHLPSNQSVRY